MMQFISQLGQQLTSVFLMKYVLVFSFLTLLTLASSHAYLVFKKEQANKQYFLNHKIFITLLAACVLLSAVASAIIFLPSPNLIFPTPPLDKAITITPESPFELIFDRPIDPAIIASFSPMLEGTWKIGYGKYGPLLADRYIFTPTKPADPNTEYQLALDRILPLTWVRLSQAQSLLLTIHTSADNIITSSNASKPPDYIIRHYSPADQETMVPLTPVINIEFEQIKSRDVVSESISLIPAAAFETHWEGDTVSVNVTQPLTSATMYTLTLALPEAGAKEPLLSWAFTTAPNTFSLDLPLYKQHHTFTCFSAASQMVLAYRDIKVGEVSFLDEIGFDPVPRNYVNNSWGDPQKGIVGTYDGSGSGGYGAHWNPVAKAISQYRPVEVKENWNLTELLEKVKEGNPVMVWWVNGVWPAKELIWKNAHGEQVRAVNGMHVEIVKGWVGDQNNPTYILTNDPWRGYRQYKPEAFLNLWKWFNNTAVIVY